MNNNIFLKNVVKEKKRKENKEMKRKLNKNKKKKKKTSSYSEQFKKKENYQRIKIISIHVRTYRATRILTRKSTSAIPRPNNGQTRCFIVSISSL